MQNHPDNTEFSTRIDDLLHEDDIANEQGQQQQDQQEDLDQQEEEQEEDSLVEVSKPGRSVPFPKWSVSFLDHAELKISLLFITVFIIFSLPAVFAVFNTLCPKLFESLETVAGNKILRPNMIGNVFIALAASGVFTSLLQHL